MSNHHHLHQFNWPRLCSTNGKYQVAGYSEAFPSGKLLTTSKMLWLVSILTLLSVLGASSSNSLTSEIEKLTAALQQLHGQQATASATVPSDTAAIKIITPPPPPPRQIPVVVQTTPQAQADVASLMARVLGELQAKLAIIRQEAERLEQKKKQLENQQKELNLKIANENVRHREELKSLHQAHVQIQAELEAAKKERERLERERLDKILQRN